MVRFESKEMGIMKKSGQIIGKVAYNHITELYQLDRTRTVEEFEKQIKNIGMRGVSIGKKGEESIYTEPLAELMELINKYKENYDEIKDIVLVYSTFYLGVIKYSKKPEGGKKNE